MIGIDSGQLSEFVFATNPVMVQVNGEHFVRSIRQVINDTDLVFFSAIDEGLVLTVANATDILSNLKDEMANLSKPRKPAAILACECLFRRLEVEQLQLTGQVSEVLSEYNVIGEQINLLHVNQTFTGVAFYAPDDPNE